VTAQVTTASGSPANISGTVYLVPSTQADPAAVRAMVDRLIRDGFLIPLEEGARVEGARVEDSRVMFKPNLLSRKPRTVPDQIWKALD